MVQIARMRTYDDGEFDDEGSAVWSVRSSDGQLRAENEAARKQLSKLDEQEVISLLRTLYLKSAQPPKKGSEARQSKSSRRSAGGGGGSGSQKHPPNPHQRHQQQRDNGSTSSSARRRGMGLFSRGGGSRVGAVDNRSRGNSKGSNSRSRSQSQSQNQNKGARRGFFGGIGRRGRNGRAPTSKIEINAATHPDFEYLNETAPYGQSPTPIPPLNPPLGYHEDGYPMTPEEEYYARLHGFPPRSPGPPRGSHFNSVNNSHQMDPRSRGRLLPPPNNMNNNHPLHQPYNHNHHQYPNLVRGEVFPLAEPVQAITTTLSPNHPNLETNPSIATPIGPHNTVHGQVCGPPRVNSLRGTVLSPIVEANDYESVKHPPNNNSTHSASASATTPNASNINPNNTNLPYQVKRQPSPPGVVNTMNRPLQSNQTTAADTQAAVKDGSANKDKNSAIAAAAVALAKSMSDPSSLPLFPVMSPISTDATDGGAPPRHILLGGGDMRHQREYVTATFDGHQYHGTNNNNDLSSVSSTYNPWNRSPNSVMSQWMKDLEPNNQCCVRGSSWYDALHYCCTRMLCDDRKSSRRHKKTSGRNRDRDRDRDRGAEDLQYHYSNANYSDGVASMPLNKYRNGRQNPFLMEYENPQNYQKYFSRHV